MLYLKDVDMDNWLDVIRLSSAEDQQNKIFEKTIASNCLSIAQASLSDSWTTKAIYDGDTLIGFTMYGYSEELNGIELCRFMVDHHFQGKGYGKKGLHIVVAEMQKQYRSSEILICFAPDNLIAKNLYEGYGFRDTGNTIKGNVDELIYSFTFN